MQYQYFTWTVAMLLKVKGDFESRMGNWTFSHDDLRMRVSLRKRVLRRQIADI
jgi:hypothetical protein